MTKLNNSAKDRISKAVKFITSNRLTETELHAELTGIAIHSVECFKNDMCIIDDSLNGIYLRKQSENNYKK